MEKPNRFGYWEMGTVKIPPLPHYIIMTDRSTGTQCLLSHTLSGSAPTTVLMSTTLPSTPDKHAYGPYEGPYIANGTRRLYVSSGTLFSEAVTDAQPVAQQRALSRRISNTAAFLEVGWSGSALTYTVVTA